MFASFLQGIDGFGTPIAVVAPLLVAFGVRPIYAVAIPIIAHIWAKFFGTLGVGWLATLQVVNLDEAATIATAYQSGLLMIIQTVLGGFTVVWLYGRCTAICHAWLLVLIIAAIQDVGQVIDALVDPVLAAFIPATAAMLALYPPVALTSLRRASGGHRRSSGNALQIMRNALPINRPDGHGNVVFSIHPADRIGLGHVND